jgi:hypothetical protein
MVLFGFRISDCGLRICFLTEGNGGNEEGESRFWFFFGSLRFLLLNWFGGFVFLTEGNGGNEEGRAGSGFSSDCFVSFC